MTEDQVTAAARRLGRLCKRRSVVLAVAESCTGGGLAEAITRIPGSSAWFDRGLVTYTNDAKRELLGVRSLTLKRHGAVSEEVAREMAAGMLKRSPADMSASITGIAGPGGGSRAKPVGLVWIAWARRGGPILAHGFHFRGNRSAIRNQSVSAAIQGLTALLG